MPGFFTAFSSNMASLHEAVKLSVVVRTCSPTASRKPNVSLPLQYLPVRKRETLQRCDPQKQEARPLVHLGRLLDGGGELGGYRSLGMFNIKTAIRTQRSSGDWTRNQRVTPSCPRGRRRGSHFGYAMTFGSNLKGSLLD